MVHPRDDVPQPLRALVVDDDPMCRRLFAAVLAAALGEVRIASAGTGSEALHHLAASPFEIVLTDLHLPGANGIEVARAARRLNAQAAIVIATGGGTEAEEEEARLAGASRWMTKPFQVDAMIAYLREATAALTGSRSPCATGSARPSAEIVR